MTFPIAPPPPAHPKPVDFDTVFADAMAFFQRGLDHSLGWPRWTAFALLGFALLLTILGRHGQRLLAGTVLGGGVVIFAILFLRAQAPAADWPGLVAVIGGGAAFALGLGIPGWTTALCSSVSLGALGGFLTVKYGGVPWLTGAIPGALLGLFLGLANHLWWGLWMPPIAAAFCVTVASVRLLGVAHEGGVVPQLLKSEWALALFGGLAVALIAISLERVQLQKKRLAAKTKTMKDEELARKVKRDRERFEKYTGSAKTPDAGDL